VSGPPKVLKNKLASPAEKTGATSALIPMGRSEQVFAKVVVAVLNVLRYPKASPEADKAAASAVPIFVAAAHAVAALLCWRDTRHIEMQAGAAE